MTSETTESAKPDVAKATLEFVGGNSSATARDDRPLRGRQQANHVRTLTGRAYVGSHLASVRVDGWSYGISKSVSWVDRDGTSHEDGWPACLAPLGATITVRFGEIPVDGPQGDSWREVVWVDCRRAVRVR